MPDISSMFSLVLGCEIGGGVRAGALVGVGVGVRAGAGVGVGVGVGVRAGAGVRAGPGVTVGVAVRAGAEVRTGDGGVREGRGGELSGRCIPWRIKLSSCRCRTSWEKPAQD